ncbi:hypothetical protein EMIHUDRAFT_255947, partial [Emiliania huxleyi CCMP1516]
EPCGDSNSACGSWADAGECGKNVGFMKAECAESCGFCTPPPMLTAADDPLLGPERVVLSIHYGEKVPQRSGRTSGEAATQVSSFSWRTIMPLSAPQQRERRAAQRAAEAQDAARGQRNRPAPSRC